MGTSQTKLRWDGVMLPGDKVFKAVQIEGDPSVGYEMSRKHNPELEYVNVRKDGSTGAITITLQNGVLYAPYHCEAVQRLAIFQAFEAAHKANLVDPAKPSPNPQ